MNKFFIACAIALSCHLSYAQNSIKGKIVDQDNAPLEGATVIVPELNKGTVSDKNGNYELSNLPKGKVKVQYSFVGYTSKIEVVYLSGSSVEVNIQLHNSIIEAEEIVVTGGYSSTQHENAVKIDVLKLDQLSNMGTPNFVEVLTKVPGVDMISKGSGVSKPVIRGLSMNDILVLNNGVRFENYQYSSHHPMGIDEFGVDNVEIIKGPASLLYGSDAIGGVINFIKERPAPQNSVVGDYNIQLFSNSLGMTNSFGIKGTSNNFFGGIRVGQKTNADYLMGGGDFVPNSRSQEYSLKTNTGYTGKIGTFRLYYDYNKQNLGLVEDEPVEVITERGRNCEIYYEQLNTHLVSSQNKLYMGKMKLDVNSAYQNTELIHFGEINEYEIQMKLATLTYETKLYLPSDKNSEYIMGFQGMNQENTNENDRETKLLPNANTNNYSGFVLLQRTFFEKLKLQTGLRYDYKTINSKSIDNASDLSTYRPALDKNYGSFSGSVGATYTLSEKLLFRANIASAYRTPNLAELTSNGQHETRYEVGDSKLSPENSYESDLNLHYHADNFTFDIAGFYNVVDNFIFISPTGENTTSGIPIYKYMQKNSFLYGGEAGFHLHPLSAKWLHFQTIYSSVIGKQKDGDYLPFIPANKLNFEFRASTDRLAFMHNAFVSVNSSTVFNQNNAAPDETTTKGYSLINLGIGCSIKVGKQSLQIAISANNIFDKKYVDHLSTLKEVNMYDPGRNISLSVKVPFGFELNK